MKILLIRTAALESSFESKKYNEQEIGLATSLTKKGHECGIVYYAKKGNGKNEIIESQGVNIKIYHLEGINFLKGAIYEKSIYEICDKYDIIQIYECDKIMSWLLYKRYPQKVILYHGPYEATFTWKHNLYTRIFYKIFAKRANYIEATTLTKSVLAENSLKQKGFKNISTIGVALDDGKFKKIDNTKIHIIKKIKKENINLLYVGKLEKRRNIIFLIEILEKLIKENNKYRLILVGKGNKKYVDKVFKFARKKGLMDYIIYEESINQENIKQLYDQCDVFLLPTSYEIFGMVLLEAMYFKIPVITTLNGGSSTLIQNRKNGIICELYKTEDWKKEINYLVENKEFKRNIIENAYNTIIDKYTWDKLSDDFIENYKIKINGKDKK